MSLYGKNESNFDIEKSFNNILFLKNEIKIAKIIAIPLFIIAAYNLLLILMEFKLIIMLIADPAFIASVAWNLISALLLIYFCFAKTYVPIVPLIIVCVLQFFGWATAHVEMTQYYYSENKLVLVKNEYLNYLDSLKIIPYFLLNDLLRDMALNSIKIYYIIEEFIKTAFLCFVLQSKRKYLNSEINK